MSLMISFSTIGIQITRLSKHYFGELTKQVLPHNPEWTRLSIVAKSLMKLEGYDLVSVDQRKVGWANQIDQQFSWKPRDINKHLENQNRWDKGELCL